MIGWIKRAKMFMDAKPDDRPDASFVIGGDPISGGRGGEYIQELTVRGDVEPPTMNNTITRHGGNTLGGK